MAATTKLLAALLALILAALATPLAAAELTIGRANEPSSIDPLFSRTGNNQMTALHMFDQLVETDENLQVHPSLAVSWRALDPLTWEIKLRENVTFHDGSPFTAADVVFSLERSARVPNSPAPFTGATAAVRAIEAPDPHTLIVRTHTPTPLLMEQLGLVYIVSARAAAGATSQDFNSGRATIGTGPYRFVDWRPSDRLVLEANPNYWRGRPAFDRVVMRFITSAPARVAALASGQVDLIDEVPATDVELLRSRGFQVSSLGTARIIYLALDSGRDRSPFVTDGEGRPLEGNPLRDARVRRAISLMIDRQAIVERLLSDAGEPTLQMVPSGLGGHDASLTVPRADLPAACRLLAEAGWPNGFGLTVHTSVDRFPGDRDLGQVLAQFLTRGGLRATTDGKLYAVYASEASRQTYSAFVFSFGSTTSNALGAYINVLATYDQAAGMGAFNRARWSNAQFDEALRAAAVEFDETRRNELLMRATRIAYEDMALVPLYFQRLYWAARPGLGYTPGRDESTLAMRARLQ